MKEKTRNIIILLLTGGIIFGFALVSMLTSPVEESLSERRQLAQFPELTAKAVLSGEFMTDFEKYAADQFPFRETFRRIKANAVYYLFRQRDNNGIYIRDGYASKLEYPLDGDSIQRAVRIFKKIYDRYLADSAVYFSIVPDKNAFMAEENGYPALDYARLTEIMTEGMSFAECIPIEHLLQIEDYYRTDTHWRQERITDVAEALAEAMKTELSGGYTEWTLKEPFYGVYSGQAALPLEGEELRYLTSGIIEGCSVYDHETGKYMGVYDLEKAEGQDPYEIFLSGSKSLLTIENPACDTGRELILFRDSFGGSIAPLLAEGYSAVTVVDIRYVSSDMLERLVDFHGQDVLFLYSTLVLNNSITLK